jgi:hypothetical protein
LILNPLDLLDRLL